MTGPALLVLVLIAGAATAFQPPTNALLVRPLGSPVGAALVSFAVGTLLLAAAYLLGGARPAMPLVRALPAYALFGGAYGALFVTVAAHAAPRGWGVGTTLTLLVAGQLAAAVAIDHFGLFGLARVPLSPARLGGLALVIAGVALVRRG